MRHIVLKIFNAIGVQDLLILVAVIPMLGLQLEGFANDPGVGWHIETGKLIAQTLTIPKVDPFLFTLTPRSWICDQWLSDLITYQIYSLGSWQLLYAIYTVAYLTIYFGVLYPCLAVCTGNRLASAVVTYLAMRAGLIHFILRPVVFGHLWFSCLFALIVYFRAKKLSKSRFIILSLIIFLLWCNTHPSFFLGYILCGGLLVEALYKRIWLRFKNSELPITVNELCLFLVGCILITIVNPNGIGLHTSIIQLAQSDFFVNYHNEWRSIDFKQLEGRIVQIFLCFIGLSALIGSWKLNKERGSLLDAFTIYTLLVFGHLGFEMVRILPDFLIIATFPTTIAVASLGRACSERALPAVSSFLRKFELVENREADTYHGLATYLLLSTIILVSSLRSGVIPFYTGEFGPQSKLRAVNIIEALKKKAKEQGRRIIVFASPDLGGTITFYGQGLVQAVYDDRNTLLGSKLYQELAESFKIEVGQPLKIQDFARSLGATMILLRKDEPIAGLLYRDKEPKIVEDETFIAFPVQREHEQPLNEHQ